MSLDRTRGEGEERRGEEKLSDEGYEWGGGRGGGTKGNFGERIMSVCGGVLIRNRQSVGSGEAVNSKSWYLIFSHLTGKLTLIQPRRAKES